MFNPLEAEIFDPKRPVPFHRRGPVVVRDSDGNYVIEKALPTTLGQDAIVILSPFLIYGMLGLFVLGGVMLYRALMTDVGIPLYVALAVFAAIIGSGFLLFYWRDVRKFRIVAFLQIIIAAASAPIAVIYNISNGFALVVALAAAGIAVADGIRCLHEIKESFETSSNTKTVKSD